MWFSFNQKAISLSSERRCQAILSNRPHRRRTGSMVLWNPSLWPTPAIWVARMTSIWICCSKTTLIGMSSWCQSRHENVLSTTTTKSAKHHLAVLCEFSVNHLSNDCVIIGPTKPCQWGGTVLPRPPGFRKKAWLSAKLPVLSFQLLI